MTTTKDILAHAEEIIGGALLIAMCLIGTLQIVSRYVMTAPLPWTEELATLLFAWLVFIGIAVALKKQEHFSIQVLVDRCPEQVRFIVLQVQRLAVIAFCLLLIIYGLQLVRHGSEVQTPVLQISRSWSYLAVPVGGLLMLLRCIESIVRQPKDRSSATVVAEGSE